MIGSVGTDDVEAGGGVGFDLQPLEERTGQKDAGNEGHADGDDALDDAIPQLLHVLEERHLLEDVGLVGIGQLRQSGRDPLRELSA